MKYKIEVEISDFEVDDRYYTFSYSITVDGKLLEKGEINDDYENGLSPKEWQKMLENGEALNLVMQKFEQ